jgi:hypothetical protein
MTELWPSSGYRLLQRDAQGRMGVTDDFLRAYLTRPEIAPVEESLDAERELHAELLATPRAAVDPARLAALGDADAEENYQVVLSFRDRLVAAGTVEACYRGLFGGEPPAVPVPPLFVDQLAHVIMRNILDGNDDPFRARAAELFFRKQTGMNQDGAILLGDDETVDMYRQHGFGNIGKLLAEAGTPTRQVELDVLNADNAAQYRDRSDRFDMVLDLTFGREGLDALCRVLEQWVAHFFDLKVSVQPAQSVKDEHWVWHIGLDATASSILNDLYNGVEVEEERLARLISLFRLEFADPRAALPQVQGRPVYLALAMAEDNSVRLKPQNLLVNLPVAETV